MKFRTMKSPMRHLGMDWYFVADRDPEAKSKPKQRLSTLLRPTRYSPSDVSLDEVEEVYNELSPSKPPRSSFKSQTSPLGSKREDTNSIKKEYKPAWYLPVDKWSRNSTEETEKYDFAKGKRYAAERVYYHLHESSHKEICEDEPPPKTELDEKFENYQKQLSKLPSVHKFIQFVKVKKPKSRVPACLASIQTEEIKKLPGIYKSTSEH